MAGPGWLIRSARRPDGRAGPARPTRPDPRTGGPGRRARAAATILMSSPASRRGPPHERVSVLVTVALGRVFP
jgi:hypothetical protein